MYSNAKNIEKCLVKSETLPTFALRTGTIRTSNVHSVDAITALSLVHFYVRSRDQFAKLWGNASFCTYTNEFLTTNANWCQESATGARCARRRRTAYETGIPAQARTTSSDSFPRPAETTHHRRRTLLPRIVPRLVQMPVSRHRTAIGVLRHLQIASSIAGRWLGFGRPRKQIPRLKSRRRYNRSAACRTR